MTTGEAGPASPGLKEAAWWPAATRMHARVHSLPWDSVTRFSLDLGEKGPVDGGRYLIPPPALCL